MGGLGREKKKNLEKAADDKRIISTLTIKFAELLDLEVLLHLHI